MNGSKAIICLHNDLDPVHMLKREIQSCSMLIACDGAVNKLNEIGLTADVVIGDLDSASPSNLKARIVIDHDEHRNDFEKALSFAKDNKFDEIVIFGLRGGDIQHELSNYLIFFAEPLHMLAYTPNSTLIRLLPKVKYSIFISPKAQFSLFTNNQAGGIELFGAQYPLSNASLSIGSRGLHNVALDEIIQIEYFDGDLVFIGPESIQFEFEGGDGP
ncbi:MAG: thiamine diphosphokinase [Candidatus Poseidoniales archaeon]